MRRRLGDNGPIAVREAPVRDHQRIGLRIEILPCSRDGFRDIDRIARIDQDMGHQVVNIRLVLDQQDALLRHRKIPALRCKVHARR